MWKEVALATLLLGCVSTVRSEESKITLGSTLDTFSEFTLSTTEPGQVYIHSIQEDEWERGNILATVGSALYTIDSLGESTLLTGSLQSKGFQNGDYDDTRFNKMSGILQMNSGRDVILSDYWNNCLRKFDRETYEVTTFAGECDVDYGTDYRGLPECPTRRDGPLESATFCSPIRLRYRNSTNTILVMDLAEHETYIREIDLNTSMVSTLFYNNSFDSRDFLDEENGYYFTFSTAPGLLKMPSSKNYYDRMGTWLAGCGNSSFQGYCPDYDTKNISMIHPHGLLKENGVYVVSDFFGNDVYLVDPFDNYARICFSNGEWLHSIYHPAAVEIIGDYLYIGQHVEVVESYNNDYYAYDDYYEPTQSIKIYRIKLSITSDYYWDLWLKREDSFSDYNTETTTNKLTTTSFVNDPTCYGYDDCNYNGYCTEGKCVCYTGHSGDYCETIETCSYDCNDNGYCSDGSCVCNTGYTGDYCQTVEKCSDSYDCNERGYCSVGSCVCNTGYTGDYCQTVEKCSGSYDCNEHGNCYDGSCYCYSGYTGDYCQTVKYCDSSSDCNYQGSCSQGQCDCYTGYRGNYCESANYCDSNSDCNYHGACSLGVCECNTGYSGTYCATESLSSYDNYETDDYSTSYQFPHHVVWPVTGGVFFIIAAIVVCCIRVARCNSVASRPRPSVSITRIVGSKVAHRKLNETGSPETDLLAVKKGMPPGKTVIPPSKRDATVVTILQPPPYEQPQSAKESPALADSEAVKPSP